MRTKQEQYVNATGAIPMTRLGRVRGRPQAGGYPFRVDLLSPPEGFTVAVEEEIIRFLERRAGACDVWGQIATGDEFLRYCFMHRIDAEAFQKRFASVAEKAVLREFFPKPEKI
jgi:hypothetical protein